MLLAGIAVTSCTKAYFVRAVPTYPKHKGRVIVYYQHPDDVRYETLGTVIVNSRQGQNPAYIVKIMQRKAAHFGANAIVVSGDMFSRLQIANDNYTPTPFKRSGTIRVSAAAIRVVE